MKREKILRQVIIVLLSALVFFALTMPFRELLNVSTVTEVRPAAGLNPVLGLLFGIPGALGCALGNFAADLMSGYSLLVSLAAFPVQLLYGVLPYYLGKRFDGNVRLNTSRNVLLFFVIVLISAVITSILISIEAQLFGIGKILSLTTPMMFFNDFVFCVVLGIPLLLLHTLYDIRKKDERLSLNERFVLLFLLLAILSALMIGMIAYRLLSWQFSNALSLWNRVYSYIGVDLLVFCIVTIRFLRNVEKNITFPMEKLATIAQDYIRTKDDGSLDLDNMISRCEQLVNVRGEAGALASAFQGMTVNMGSYIDNLTRITAEKEQIDAELDVARRIQENMLPNTFPPFPEREEFDIYASMHPAKEVGGDFYDFFLVDDDHLVLVIADVSGKGIPASLFMMISKILLKSAVEGGRSPKEVLEKVNNLLCENNKAQMFVTVWLGILQLSTGELVAANAGHEYPTVRRKDGSFELLKDKHGFVLAGMEDMRYEEYTISLEKGDTLFVYTDGVTEAMNQKGEMYGTSRMLAALNLDADAEPRTILGNVSQDITRFVGDAEQFDDITMMAVKLAEKGSMKVGAQTKNWNKVAKYAEQVFEKADCPQKEALRILTAMEEIFVNISSYAYPDSEGYVFISIETDADHVTVTFEDSGAAYNPLEREDPDTTLSADEREIGGLGIHIVKKLMDHIAYEYCDGKNRLTMIKNL